MLAGKLGIAITPAIKPRARSPGLLNASAAVAGFHSASESQS